MGLMFIAVASALWFTFMIRYPRQWGDRIDRLHAWLGTFWFSFGWMQRAEKGLPLKLVVAALVVTTLMCAATLWRHPTALVDFIREVSHPRS